MTQKKYSNSKYSIGTLVYFRGLGIVTHKDNYYYYVRFFDEPATYSYGERAMDDLVQEYTVITK